MKKAHLLVALFITTSCGSSTGDEIPEQNLQILKNDEIVRDIDGNKYQTVKINERIWLSSNLKATKFSNGDPVPNLLKDSEWKKAKGPAYCFFNNSKKNSNFGCLYNLYTIIDKRNICPKGWHVPTEKEFFSYKIVENKLFNNRVLGWRRVYDDSDEKNQFSTFFHENSMKGGTAIYWTGDSYMEEDNSTESPTDSIVRGNNVGVSGEYYFGNKYDGFPCRCIKDTLGK